MAKRRGRSRAFMLSINPHLRKKRKINKVRHFSSGMARRKTRGKRRYTSRGFMSGVLGLVVGVAGYLVFDAIVKPFIPISGTILAFGELALGGFLATRRSGFLKHFGIAMLVISTFALAKVFIAPSLGNLIPISA